MLEPTDPMFAPIAFLRQLGETDLADAVTQIVTDRALEALRAERVPA